MKPDILTYQPLRWKLTRPSFHRILSMVGLMSGEVTFGDFLKFLPPGRFKSEETHKKHHDFTAGYINRTVRPFIDTDGSFNLYGKPVYPFRGNYRELIGHFLEVITNDQYHAKKLIKEGDVVIDVGANMGTFSIMVANQTPSTPIYAFEPIQETYDVLRRNTAPYASIHPYPLALGDTTAIKEMIHYETMSEASRISDGGLNDVLSEDIDAIVSEKVSVTTLDAFAKEHALERMDFIKIDAEGYEGNILKGAAESIKKFKPVIAMSAYHRPNDKTELPRILKSICPDYVCRLYKDCEEDFICYVPDRQRKL